MGFPGGHPLIVQPGNPHVPLALESASDRENLRSGSPSGTQSESGILDNDTSARVGP